MERKILLAPGVSPEKRKLLSIEGLILWDKIADTLTDEERVRLENIYPDRKVRMWGVRPEITER